MVYKLNLLSELPPHASLSMPARKCEVLRMCWMLSGSERVGILWNALRCESAAECHLFISLHLRRPCPHGRPAGY